MVKSTKYILITDYIAIYGPDGLCVFRLFIQSFDKFDKFYSSYVTHPLDYLLMVIIILMRISL